jgi:2C-methyl-D-erythritol 2,4-cyclodiphosphate synthase
MHDCYSFVFLSDLSVWFGQARLAELLEVEAEAVNVKGKTFEGLGALADGRGVAVQAVCLVRRA